MRTAPLTVAAVIASPAAAQLVVFVHDQSADEIYRLEDLNNDGDANDPGEATLFMNDDDTVLGIDNAQGLVALDARTLLATDNFDPDNVLYLRDANADGDALDPGEARVWFSGALPGGFDLTNPAELIPADGNAFYLLDNNTLDTANPEAIYRLEDLNGDLDTDDPGETTLFFGLSPAGVSTATTLGLARNNAGAVFTLDISDPNQIESIDIIDPAGNARTEWFDSVDLLNLTGTILSSTQAELEHFPATDEIVFGATDLGGTPFIIGARDNNNSGTIDTASELRPLWSEPTSGFSTGTPRDLHIAPDGSLLWTDGLQDRVMRLVDLNGDNDFRDPGETTVYYDASGATANGLTPLALPLSITSAPTGPTPCNLADLAAPFGFVDLSDLDAFIAAFTAGDPAADLAAPFGFVDLTDVDAFITAFLAGCP